MRELDRPASIGCTVSRTKRPRRTNSWRPALSTHIDDDANPTRVARRLLRPSPSDSRPEKEFVALQKYAKREPAWLSSPPFASKYLASHHHQNHHRSDRRPRRGPTATSWGSIFLTPGRLPDPAPLCFAPLLVQNPNTEVVTRTCMLIGWVINTNS